MDSAFAAAQAHAARRASCTAMLAKLKAVQQRSCIDTRCFSGASVNKCSIHQPRGAQTRRCHDLQSMPVTSTACARTQWRASNNHERCSSPWHRSSCLHVAATTDDSPAKIQLMPLAYKSTRAMDGHGRLRRALADEVAQLWTDGRTDV